MANTERFTPVTDHALDHPPAADGCVLTQLVGNVAFQWALGQIDLALTVPLSMGMLLIGSAVLARLGLAGPIPPRSAAAMLLLVCSITVLTWLPTRVRQRFATSARLPSGGLAAVWGSLSVRLHLRRGKCFHPANTVGGRGAGCHIVDGQPDRCSGARRLETLVSESVEHRPQYKQPVSDDLGWDFQCRRLLFARKSIAMLARHPHQFADRVPGDVVRPGRHTAIRRTGWRSADRGHRADVGRADNDAPTREKGGQGSLAGGHRVTRISRKSAVT